MLILGCVLLPIHLFAIVMNAIDGFKELKTANALYRNGNENDGRRLRNEALWSGIFVMCYWFGAVLTFYAMILPDLWPGYWTISIIPK